MPSEENEDITGYTVKEILDKFVVSEIRELKKQIAEDSADKNKRISSLEAWQGKIMAGVAILAAILVPVASPVVLSTLNGLFS